MTYKETLLYLYNSIPAYQRCGAAAYKPGLGTTIALDDRLGNPHRAYRTIHVAGTNGKGSVSHLLAAILQESGYKVGLYTSPHLLDFRERIRVNGRMVPEAYVTDFVERHRAFFEPLHPSFFELTSTLAFDYFREEGVDFAVIEVGLGGRLDSTNIITPVLSVITNISLDHTQFLGDTLEKIAAEKAGIIKPGVPALVGEADDAGVREVFVEKAHETGAPLYFAREMPVTHAVRRNEAGLWEIDSADYGTITDELAGEAQERNACTVLATLRLLREQGIGITEQAVRKGFAEVVELTGLMGRWQTLRTHPLTLCDTGHNPGGWVYLATQLEHARKRYRRLHMIVGMVNDKDIDGVLACMPKAADYFFTQAAIERALPAEEFAEKARAHGLEGCVCRTVAEAVARALAAADSEDMIFIGGSTFIVAEALPLFREAE